MLEKVGKESHHVKHAFHQSTEKRIACVEVWVNHGGCLQPVAAGHLMLGLAARRVEGLIPGHTSSSFRLGNSGLDDILEHLPFGDAVLGS